MIKQLVEFRTLLNYALLLTLSFSLSCAAATSTVTVVDQDNKPVSNAVVAFLPIPNELNTSLNATTIADQETAKRADTANIDSDNENVAIMDQVDKQFLPRVIAIQKGQRVKFPNSDDIRHHVYSFSPTKPFEIKLYKGSSVDPVLFDKAGIGTLGCNIHDDMVGHIYVSDGEVTSVSDSNGIASFDQSVPESVIVWHEDLSIDGSLKVKVILEESDITSVASVTLVRRAPPPKKRTFGASRFGG
ncbi:methylamine utilization protein [Alteromonas sp. BMJM2]|jgi:plastocyanin|uniref:methylamine utilization protein n=1 Tax=Alteromonas sp. BMJM2 TaxID=2954241 RepID=UPI0022B30E4E|nr:methylamine utilization protein [Alteromonas sp. BMJM2]